MKESTVQDWEKAYEFNLCEKRKLTEPGKAVIISTLDAKRRGRPPLLGTKLDLMLQERIIAMRERGTSIGLNTVIGIGRGILLKYKKSSLHKFGGPITLNKDWAGHRCFTLNAVHKEKSQLKIKGFTYKL